jgi:Family of unknown function (DUF7033)
MERALLNIATDEEDRRWLKYLMEEFSRINKAEFSIKICNYEQGCQNTNSTIYYTKHKTTGVWIPNRSHILPKGNVLWLSKKIYIFKDTTDDAKERACAYDMFWNAFIFLTRFEEYQNQDRGKKNRSYVRYHPRSVKETFDIPVVNNLFNELEDLINKHFPFLQFGNLEKPIVELSHDVDYLNKSPQLRLKQTVLNIFNTIISLNNPAACTEQLSKTIRFFFSSPSYWYFDYWTELEKKFNLRSIFYIFAKTRSSSLISWLVDPSYDLRCDPVLQNKLKEMIEDGFEIGLHGSYRGAIDEGILKEEKKILEETLQTDICKVRQHWLRYEETVTPYLHDKLFKYDSTLGWNDRIGFRSGCASRYRPYDHLNQKAFKLFITPQIIMDSTIFDYSAKKIVPNIQKALTLLRSMSCYKTSHVSISWHQRVRSGDYNWHRAYEEILAALFSGSHCC